MIKRREIKEKEGQEGKAPLLFDRAAKMKYIEIVKDTPISFDNIHPGCLPFRGDYLYLGNGSQIIKKTHFCALDL